MKQDSNQIGPMLQNFFVEYLCNLKRVSTQTISSYRDTFRLLLEFIHDKYRIEPAAVSIKNLDVDVIISFLNHLEQSRHNSIRSRNLRLAAIRSFFRLVALRDPSQVNHATRILSIPVKRTDRRLIKAITREEVEAILSTPDLTKWSGRRDHALLLTLYNSGARVSEITDLEQSQFCFGPQSFLRFQGKGRKERAIPLWTKTACALRNWFRELSDRQTNLAFVSAQGRKLTRNGVDYILQQAVGQAVNECSSLRDKKITPHVVRHTTATHLLQSGVDISVIALWLGHESIETTHVYLEADLATKQRALNKLAPAGSEIPRFKAKDEVLAFLATL